MNKTINTIPDEIILSKIHLIRNNKVMIDTDLALLYGVDTKQLKRQVRRNLERFPTDFMFQITQEEYNSLRSQFGTLKQGEHSKYLPFVFTEQGVAMLSSVLSSKTAIEINIHIIRIFTRLREMMLTHKDILLKLEQLEQQVTHHSMEMQNVFDALKQLIQQPIPPRKSIGFKTPKDHS